MLGKWRAKKALQQKRPLPTGVKEFHEWSDRIIQGAQLTATTESLKYTLANIICNNCGPTVAFETDHYFISLLRKHAANQVAVHIREEIYRKKKEEQSQGAATPPQGEDAKVLEITRV